MDQANTQKRLDSQREEDMLIQKLMKQQTEEQNNAYADERLRKCKAMITEQRRDRALQTQEVRDAKHKIMEQEAKREAKGREAQRKQQIERQQEEYSKIHRETKLQKRGLNIEICSGIVDLILDVADEVYDVTQKQPGKKLTKAQWREFSAIFVDGKKVTLRNFKKQIVDLEKQKDQDEGTLDVLALPAY